MSELDKKLIDCGRYRKTEGRFGVEIEVEGERLPENIFGWVVHKEGSLRGEAKEFVTEGAVDYEELEDRLLILNQVKDATGSNIFDSYRASVHIHVNCQQQTNHEIIGAILAFAMVEPVFMRLCGQTRDGNLFCLPSYDCGDLNDYMDSVGVAFSQGYNFIDVMRRGKYSALNTDPLLNFGTLEFRTFPTSVDTSTILKWARQCDKVVKFGAKMKNFTQEIGEFYKNPMPALVEIFGEDMQRFANHEIDAMVDVGAENAFDAARVYESHFEKIKKAA